MTAVKRRKPRRLFIHRKRASASLPPTSSPLAAVLVALDSAMRTGYGTYVAGRLWDYGEINARKPAERARVFSDAIQAGYLRNIPVGVVIEVPWGGYQSTALSLHATAAAWRETWLLTGLPTERCIERTAGEWRRKLFGRQYPREQARRFEAALASRIALADLGFERCAMKGRIGPDAAAAICIGQTIIRARELLAVLGCGCVSPRKG
jgi:hypothetical protein